MRHLILGWITLIFLWSCQDLQTPPEPFKNTAMPGFNLLTDNKGSVVPSTGIGQGKPTAILVYRPDCPYCNQLMKNIVDDMSQLKNIQFCLISSSQDSAVQSFKDHYKIAQFNNVISGVDTANVLIRYYNIQGLPFLALYDNKHILQKTYYGVVTGNEILKALN